MDEAWIGIVGIVCLFGLPVFAYIVNSLLRHQRQMAEMVQHGNKLQDAELSQLRREVSELKDLLLTHSLSLDTNVDVLKKRLENVEQRSGSENR
jgi:hypothetical protein